MVNEVTGLGEQSNCFIEKSDNHNCKAIGSVERSAISTLMDKGVDFIAEMQKPSVPNPFHSAMAEEEARLISQRTSLALKKERNEVKARCKWQSVG